MDTRNRNRRPGVFGLLCLVAAAALGGCSGKTGPAEDAAGEAPATAVVEAGDFTVTISATGKVEAETEVEVKSKASGEIVEFPFEVGDPVKPGDLVCRLDPQDEERNVERATNQIESARARLAAAEASLRLAEADREQAQADAEAGERQAVAQVEEAEARLTRDEGLLRKGVVSAEDVQTSRTRAAEARSALDRARAAVTQARARTGAVEKSRQDARQAETEVNSARIALDEARVRLADTRILAPIGGVVTETLVEKGRVISSAISNVGGGTSLLKIADLTRLYVRLAVDEVDIGRVRAGQPARVRVDAFPDRSLGGSVVQIAPTGVEKQNVVQFDVKVSVEGEEARVLRPGMTADVDVEVGRSPDTLWVPRDAVDPETATAQVLRPDGSTEERKVEVGLRDAYRVEIKKGLAAGETVLLNAGSRASSWRKPEGGGNSRNTTRFLMRLRRR